MFEVLPELIALGVATVGPYIFYSIGKSKNKGKTVEKKCEFLSGFTFGVAILQNGLRSPLEHAIINKLHEYDAQCVLAGRSTVRAMVLDKDVIDSVGISNPQFVIVGTVEEKEIFLEGCFRPERSGVFLKWLKAKYRVASGDSFEAQLMTKFNLRHEEVYQIYIQETGQ
ncbi:MAG: hypothetical protein AAB611_03395, partial [Patescibacteria group bacterium]